MRLPKTWLLLLLAVLWAGAGPLAAGEGVLLVPRFAPGERVRYRLNLTVETESSLGTLESPGPSETPLRLAFDLTWQVEALTAEADGSISLRAVIEALHVESSPPEVWSAATDTFVGKAISYKLLPDRRVDSIQAPPEWLENGQTPAWLRTWLEQGSTTGSGLPTEPVAPGRQWSAEREFEVEGLPRQRLTSHSTYLRDQPVGAATCALVVTRFAVTGADKQEESAPIGGRTTVERTVEGGGSRLGCYDHRNGRLLESSQTSREHVRLEMRQQPEKSQPALPAVVLESRTTTESHLRVVE